MDPSGTPVVWWLVGDMRVLTGGLEATCPPTDHAWPLPTPPWDPALPPGDPRPGGQEGGPGGLSGQDRQLP